VAFGVLVELVCRIACAALGDAGPAHGHHAGHPATRYVVAEATVVNIRVKRGIRIGVATMAVWRGLRQCRGHRARRRGSGADSLWPVRDQVRCGEFDDTPHTAGSEVAMDNDQFQTP
jgi:hypothetical protein